MRDALELNGYAVVTAADGRAALAKIDSLDHICVVLLDLLMPGMNGWDFFEKVRERRELDAVPIVIHSSAVARAPQGAARVFVKPMSFDQLIAVVREYCAA